MTNRLLPVRIPGTTMIVEPGPDEKFKQDRGKSLLQVLCEDERCRPPTKMLEPRYMNALWDPLRNLYDPEVGEDGIPRFDHEWQRRAVKQFYHPELKSYGAEAGDLEPTLVELYHEMRFDQHLLMNALVVLRNNSGLVTGLKKARLPASVYPVSVSTKTSIKIDNYGVSLDAFRQSGGHLVAHHAFPPPLEFSGDCSDELNYGDVCAVEWMLGPCPVDGPSNTYDFVPVDYRGWHIGTLRGRKSSLTKTTIADS